MRKNVKKVIMTLMLLLLFIGLPATAFGVSANSLAAPGRVEMVHEGKRISAPLTYGRAFVKKGTNRTVIPLRLVMETLGAEVEYHGEKTPAEIHIKNDATKIILQIGSESALIRQQGRETSLIMDVAPFLYENRTYVPLRFLSESMGKSVIWKPMAKVNYVIISDDPGAVWSTYHVGGKQVSGVFIHDEEYFLSLLETFRNSKGIPGTVYRHPLMSSLSKARCVEEAVSWMETKDIDHLRPDGTSVGTFENLIYSPNLNMDEAMSLKLWINSPGHYANLVQPLDGKSYPAGYGAFLFDDGDDLSIVTAMNFHYREVLDNNMKNLEEN